MKQFLKKYKAFLLLLAVQFILSLLLPEIGSKAFTQIKNNLTEMLGILPPIFILLGLLDVWVDKQTMIKFTGKGSGTKGFLLSFLLGSAAAGPLYAAFPVAVVMRKKGSSLLNIFIFLGAWSTTKIPMLTFEAANLGVPFMAVRLTLSVIGIVLIARVLDATVSGADLPPIAEKN